MLCAFSSAFSWLVLIFGIFGIHHVCPIGLISSILIFYSVKYHYWASWTNEVSECEGAQMHKHFAYDISSCRDANVLLFLLLMVMNEKVDRHTLTQTDRKWGVSPKRMTAIQFFKTHFFSAVSVFLLSFVLNGHFCCCCVIFVCVAFHMLIIIWCFCGAVSLHLSAIWHMQMCVAFFRFESPVLMRK